jgi:acid phosphatase type 7
MSPAGAVERESGIREFVVGTGGNGLYQLVARPDGTREVADDLTIGVLKLTLLRHRYDWQFVSEPGKTFTDRGSGVCH